MCYDIYRVNKERAPTHPETGWIWLCPFALHSETSLGPERKEKQTSTFFLYIYTVNLRGFKCVMWSKRRPMIQPTWGHTASLRNFSFRLWETVNNSLDILVPLNVCAELFSYWGRHRESWLPHLISLEVAKIDLLIEVNRNYLFAN